MKNYIIFIVLIIVSVSCNDPRQYMEAHQKTPAGGTFYSFKGKIVDEDSLRWGIDLSGDTKAEIFAFKEVQTLQLEINDSVNGDDLNGYYVVKNKR